MGCAWCPEVWRSVLAETWRAKVFLRGFQSWSMLFLVANMPSSAEGLREVRYSYLSIFNKQIPFCRASVQLKITDDNKMW